MVCDTTPSSLGPVEAANCLDRCSIQMSFAHGRQAGYAQISVANERAKGKADSVQVLLRSFVNFCKGAGKLSKAMLT